MKMRTIGHPSTGTADQSVSPSNKPLPNDHIYRETKWLSAFIVPFLVAAFYILYLRPTETKDLFAWEIKPPMTAMMLGAVYIGGAYFFLRVLLAKQWHWIKLGFIPVTVFAFFLCIATILHWDRFTHNHISFITWVALYFTTPFLVSGTWLHNRSTDSGTPDPNDAVLPQSVRIVMGTVGVITLLLSLLLFVQPSLMISVWPWTLTPLTARVVGAMFGLGVVGLGIALERRWSSIQIILQAEAFMLFMILTATIRAWVTDFDPSKPASWLFLGGLVIVIIIIVAFYVVMESLRIKTIA
jgi:hypothetical protein